MLYGQIRLFINNYSTQKVAKILLHFVLVMNGDFRYLYYLWTMYYKPGSVFTDDIKGSPKVTV